MVDTNKNSERTLVESWLFTAEKGEFVLITLEELLILRTAINFPKAVYIILIQSGGSNIVYWVFFVSWNISTK